SGNGVGRREFSSFRSGSANGARKRSRMLLRYDHDGAERPPQEPLATARRGRCNAARSARWGTVGSPPHPPVRTLGGFAAVELLDGRCRRVLSLFRRGFRAASVVGVVAAAA